MAKQQSAWAACLDTGTKQALPYSANTRYGGKPLKDMKKVELKDFFVDQERTIGALVADYGVSNFEAMIGRAPIDPESLRDDQYGGPLEAGPAALAATVNNVVEEVRENRVANGDPVATYITESQGSDSTAIGAARKLLSAVETDAKALQATLDAYFGNTPDPFSSAQQNYIYSVLEKYNWKGEVPENIGTLADRIAGDPRVAKKGQEAQRQTAAGTAQEVDQGFDDDTSPDSVAFGNFDNADQLYYNEGGRAVSLEPGAVRAAVRSFLKQLKAVLPTRVYSSRDDLAAKDPDLWRTMVDSNPRLESGESVAAAYHQGRVYVFADAIFSPNHLRFVLSHEMLGHHGLRALIGRDKLAKVLDGLYAESQEGLRVGTWLADGVDAMLTRNPQMGKLEAIEEVLADKAAALATDPYPLIRIFKAIKNAIKRFFGMENPEDLAVYALHQARKYVRSGEVTSGFSLDSVIRDSTDLGAKTGPFADVRLHENPSLAVMQQNSYDSPDINAFFSKSLKAKATSARKFANNFLHDFYKLQVFSARENPGYNLMYKLFDNARNTASRIRQQSNERLARFFGMSGPIEVELNRMLFIGDALRTSLTKDKSLKQVMGDAALEPLFDYLDLDLRPPSISTEVIDRFLNKGILPIEAFKKGIEVEGFSSYKPNESLSDADYKRAYEAYVEFRTAFRDTEAELVRAKYSNVIDSMDLGWGDLVFSAQNSLGAAREVDTTANLRIFREIHRRAIREIINANVKLDGGAITNSSDLIKEAGKFSVAVNTYLRAKDPNRNDATPDGVQKRANNIREFFPGQNIDSFIDDLEMLRASFGYEYGSLDGRIVQESVKRAAEEHFSALRDDYNMKWSLIKGYTPIMREGNLQVRVVALDPATGKPVSIPQDFEAQLLFSLFDDSVFAGKNKGRAAAESLAKDLNSKFSGKVYDIPEEAKTATNARESLKDDDADPPQTVKLKALVEDSVVGVQSPPSVDPGSLLRALDAFGVTLDPKQTGSIIEALTDQGSALRKKLYREGKPGSPYLGNKAISKHIEQRASVAGKAGIASRLTHLFGRSPYSRNLWAGDGARVERLTTELEALPEDSARRKSLQRELDLAQYRFDKTNPASGSRENTYRNRAYSAVRFFDGQADVEFSAFDLGGTVATAKTLTSVAYLGGSLASAGLNIISIATNVIPFLATYNSNRAFGGGFGFTEASSAISEAMRVVGSAKMATADVILRKGEPSKDPNNAAYYDSIAREIGEAQKKGKPKDHTIKGLTLDEARFLAQEITEGKMIPAISNMVMYSARGMPSALTKFAKPIDAYMTLFNQTEQYGRRVSGLAAYRLHRDRALAELKADASPNSELDASSREAVYQNARAFAAEMLDVTLGEYSAMNRPPIFRGGGGLNGFIGLMYTYKTFPTTMTLLLRNLPPEGALAMAASLWLTGGIMSMPFAEDIEDILDTIGQTLKLWGSSRLLATEFLQEVAPNLEILGAGVDAVVMRGLMQTIPGIGTLDVGSRLSLGNQAPLTGILVEGQNVANEVNNFLGPVWSAAADSVVTLGRLTLEAGRGLAGAPTEFQQIARESPIVLARNLSDAWVYTATGAIVNKKGAIIAPGEQLAGVISRALGFYPQVAATNNDFAAMMVRNNAFVRGISSSQGDRYMRYKLQGNPEGARAVVDWINAWNLNNPDQQVRNFLKNAERKVREARKPGLNRLLASSPVAQRRYYLELLDDEDLL